jgi:hypothetical protein
MSIPQVQISGKIVTPDGVGVAGGELLVALSFPGTVHDPVADVDHRVGGIQRFAIGIDGSVSGVVLVPNSQITPVGSFYTVTYKMPGGSSWYELWQLADDTPIEIGDVPLLGSQPVGTELMLPMRSVSPSSLASGATRGHLYLVPGGAGEEDKTYVVLKGTDDVYRSKVLAFGGGPD